MLFLYANSHSHNLLFLWLVTPDYLVVSLKWLNIVATLSLVFPSSFPYCQLQSLVFMLHWCYIYPYCLCGHSFWWMFVLQSLCCEHTTAETVAIITLYLASLADQITVCFFMCFSVALKYSVALCQQKCKRRGTLESNYCSSNFGKVANAN